MWFKQVLGNLKIDCKLPSLNEYVRACRTHKQVGGKFKKEVEEVIGWAIKLAVKKQELRPIDEPCEIYIDWHEKTKRRDVDNIQSAQKYILDALQKYGILKNDSRNYVKQIHHDVIDDTSDFVEVMIISAYDETKGEKIIDVKAENE